MRRIVIVLVVLAILALVGFVGLVRGELVFQYDPMTPFPDVLVGNQSVVFQTVKATSVADSYTLTGLTFDLYGLASQAVVSCQLLQDYTPLATVPVCVSGNRVLADFTGLNAQIPANTISSFVLKTTFGAVSGDLNGSSMTTAIVSQDSVRAVDAAGSVIQPILAQTPIDTTYSYLVAAKPVFTIDPSTPSGLLIPASSTKIATINISLRGDGEVSFGPNNDDGLIFGVEQNHKHSDGSYKEWKLFCDGVLLKTTTMRDDSDSVWFLFNNSSLALFPGMSHKLDVYTDTTEFVSPGDFIQLWLNPRQWGPSCAWTVDGNYPVSLGDFIYQGEQAGLLSVPGVQAPEPSAMATMVAGAIAGLVFLLKKGSKKL